MRDWTDFVMLWLVLAGLVFILGSISFWRGLSDDGHELGQWRFMAKVVAGLLGASALGGLLLAVVYVLWRLAGEALLTRRHPQKSN